MVGDCKGINAWHAEIEGKQVCVYWLMWFDSMNEGVMMKMMW
jgi:hypothetical protein